VSNWDFSRLSVRHVEDRRLGIYKIHVFQDGHPYAYFYRVMDHSFMLEKFHGSTHEVDRFIGDERLRLQAYYHHIIGDVLAGKYTLSTKEVEEHEILMNEEKEKVRAINRQARENYKKFGHRKGEKGTWKYKKTKYQIVKELITKEPTLTQNELCARTGVSRTTVHRAMQEWRLEQHESVGH